MEWIRVLFRLTGLMILKGASEESLAHFHFVNLSVSWADAQSYCRLKHGDLAMVKDKDDQRLFQSFLRATGAQASWIGLRRTARRQWRWSDGTGTMELQDVWNIHDASNNEWCMKLLGDGTWRIVTCADFNQYICYDLNEEGRRSFHSYHSLVTWRAAQDFCRRDHVDLVTAESPQTNDAIRGFVPGGHQAWIGLFSDAWEWSDGSKRSYRFWGHGAHEGNCAAARLDTERMAAAECAETKPFVCGGEMKIKKTVVEISISTTADLSSTVGSEIIKQLGSHFSQNHISDFTLRWRAGQDNTVFQLDPPISEQNRPNV